MTTTPRRRFFWRVYLNGVLLLLLVGLALFVVSELFESADEPRVADRMLGYLGEHLAEARADPPRLARDLARALDVFHAEVTIYQDGVPVASNVQPPLAPLSAAESGQLADGLIHLPGRTASAAMRLGSDPNAYVVFARRDLFGSSPWRPAAVFAGVLVALALASIPLARAVAAPLERLGRAARALGSGDLSARTGLRRKDEIGAVATAFDEMAHKLERSIVSEKMLLANISHELRTPIARIRIALDLLEEEAAGAPPELVRGIATDLAELDQLVDDVLTTARLDLSTTRTSGGQLPMRRSTVDFASLLRDAADRFRAAHGERTLELDVADALPEVCGDPVLLRRVVENLLDNAGKYSDAGAPIIVRAAATGGGLAVEVKDRGIGVDEADLPRLFTPFFRTARSRAHGTRGVGLGLALSRRIVEAHGGTIAATSRAGAGTTVRFELPLGGP